MSDAFAIRPRNSLAIALLTVGTLWLAFTYSAQWRLERFEDFHLFYATAKLPVARWYTDRVPIFVPPFFLLLMQLLTWLPEPGAWVLWQLASIAVVGVVVVMRRWTLLEVAILICSAPVWAQMYFGQVVWILVALLALAVRLGKRQRWQAAGVLVGIAISLKPFFWPMLLPALWDREWRRMGLTAVTTAITVTILSVVACGPDVLRRYLSGYTAAQAFASGGVLNASLAGLLIHFGLPASAASAAVALGCGVWLRGRWTALQEDAKWSGAVMVSLSASPIAWIQYGLCLVPVLTHERTKLVVGIACIPPLLVLNWPQLRGVYVIGLAACFVELLATAGSRPRASATSIVTG